MSTQQSILVPGLTLAQAIARLRASTGPETLRWRSLVGEVAALPHVHCCAIIKSTAVDRQAEILALEPRVPAGAALPKWLQRAVKLSVDSAMDSVREPFDSVAERGDSASQELILLRSPGETAHRVILAVLTDQLSTEQFDQIHAALELFFGACMLAPIGAVEGSDARMRPVLSAVEVLAAMNEQTRATGSSLAFCNELSIRFNADRVSLGFVRARFVRLFVQSHVDRFVRRTQAVGRIEAAMEECLDQDIEVVFPAPESSAIISRDHESLAQSNQIASVVSLPLRRAGQVRGVVTIERSESIPFHALELAAIRLSCELSSARLIDLHENDRWLGALAMRSIRRTGAAIVGPRHVGAKLLALLVLAFLLIAAFVPGMDRVSASATLVAANRHVVSAPFDGVLLAVFVRAGDPVVAGVTKIAQMDTSELALQRAEASAARASSLIEAATHRSQGRISDAQIAEAQAAQSQARLDLLDAMIQRSEIFAPVNGIVLTGDQMSRAGSTIQIGTALFEVGDPDEVLLEVAVDETRIRDVKPGQAGSFAPASNPAERVPIVVESISPVAEVISRSNVFVVRARLAEHRAWLAPGVEGVARVECGKRALSAIWMRGLIDWLRLRIWW